MGTDRIEDTIASALFGRARRAVLALLFSRADESFYLRQIVRAAGVGQGAVQRELAALSRAGILVRTRSGNQVFYRANRQCPVFHELVGLVTKTVGVADVLRSALAGLSDRADVVFIYGSVARGAAKASSDVDVMVIGEADFGEVVDAVRPAQDVLGREVNPSVYSADEVRRRVSDVDHFLTSVLSEPKIFIVGGEDELRAVVGSRPTD